MDQQQIIAHTLELSSLETIFQKKQLNALEMLSQNNLLQELRKDSDLFTKLLVNHQNSINLIKEMFQIIIHPSKFIDAAPTEKTVNSLIESQKLTYRCIQVLTSQDDDFLNFVLKNSVTNQKQKSNTIIVITAINDKIQQEQFLLKTAMKQQQEMQNKTQIKKTDEVKQKPSSLLDYLFSLLTLKKQQSQKFKSQSQKYPPIVLVQETSLSYFAKFIQQFLYNKSTLIMKYLFKLNQKVDQISLENAFSTNSINKILDHKYSRSISELINRILQAEGQSEDFFIKQKVQTIIQIQKSILSLFDCSQIKNQSKLCIWLQRLSADQNFSDYVESCLQNYCSIIQNLSDKCQDRYQKTKYLQLLKQLLNSNQNIILNMVAFLQKQNKAICTLVNQKPSMTHENVQNVTIKYFKIVFRNIMRILQAFLKFDEAFHRILKQKSNANASLRNKKKFEKSQQSMSQVNDYDLKLDAKVFKSIQHLLSQIFNEQHQMLQNNNKTLWSILQKQTITMVTYFQLLKTFMMVYPSLKLFQSKRNILKLFVLIQKSAQKNILHNIIKQVFVLSLKQQEKCMLIKNFFSIEKQQQKYQQKRSIAQKHIIQTIEDDKTNQYVIQIYQIGKTLLSKITTQDLQDQKQRQIYDTLKVIVNLKDDFYTKIIGGDPRKVQDSWGDDSSQLVFAREFQNYKEPMDNILQEKEEVLGNLNSDLKLQNSSDFIQTNQNHWVQDDGVALDSEHSLSEDNSLSKDQKQTNQVHLKNPFQSSQKNFDNNHPKFEKILNDQHQLSLNLSVSFNQQKQKQKQLLRSKQMEEEWLKLSKLNQLKIENNKINSLNSLNSQDFQNIDLELKNSAMQFDISQIAEELQKV